MILRTQPGKPWTEHDFLLLEAYQILQDERCSQCGLPRWICHNEDGDVSFKVIEDTCFAKRELEIVDENKSKKNKKYKPPKGTVARPEPFTFSGRALDGVFRDAYYEAEYEKRNPDND